MVFIAQNKIDYELQLINCVYRDKTKVDKDLQHLNGIYSLKQSRR